MVSENKRKREDGGEAAGVGDEGAVGPGGVEAFVADAGGEEPTVGEAVEGHGGEVGVDGDVGAVDGAVFAGLGGGDADAVAGPEFVLEADTAGETAGEGHEGFADAVGEAGDGFEAVVCAEDIAVGGEAEAEGVGEIALDAGAEEESGAAVAHAVEDGGIVLFIGAEIGLGAQPEVPVGEGGGAVAEEGAVPFEGLAAVGDEGEDAGDAGGTGVGLGVGGDKNAPGPVPGGGGLRREGQEGEEGGEKKRGCFEAHAFPFAAGGGSLHASAHHHAHEPGEDGIEFLLGFGGEELIEDTAGHAGHHEDLGFLFGGDGAEFGEAGFHFLDHAGPFIGEVFGEPFAFDADELNFFGLFFGDGDPDEGLVRILGDDFGFEVGEGVFNLGEVGTGEGIFDGEIPGGGSGLVLHFGTGFHEVGAGGGEDAAEIGLAEFFQIHEVTFGEDGEEGGDLGVGLFEDGGVAGHGTHGAGEDEGFLLGEDLLELADDGGAGVPDVGVHGGGEGADDAVEFGLVAGGEHVPGGAGIILLHGFGDVEDDLIGGIGHGLGGGIFASAGAEEEGGEGEGGQADRCLHGFP